MLWRADNQNQITNMQTPLVTVAIPAYNAGAYLDYAIRSTLNQTYTNIELLLINDGSTDNTIEIMHAYTGDARVKIINDGANRGLIYRLNESVRLASGKYYARMDADDIMHPERIERQVKYLESNPSTDVVGSAFVSIDHNNSPIGVRLMQTVFPKRLKATCFCHPSVVGKAEWFRSNPYDPRCFRLEDLDLWKRTREHSLFFNFCEPLLFYRDVGTAQRKKYNNSMKTGIRYFLSRGEYDVVFKRLLKVTLFNVFSLIGREDVMLKKRSKPLDKYDFTKFTSHIRNAIKPIAAKSIA